MEDPFAFGIRSAPAKQFRGPTLHRPQIGTPMTPAR